MEEHTFYIRYDNGGAIVEYDGQIYIDPTTEDLIDNDQEVEPKK